MGNGDGLADGVRESEAESVDGGEALALGASDALPVADVDGACEPDAVEVEVGEREVDGVADGDNDADGVCEPDAVEVEVGECEVDGVLDGDNDADAVALGVGVAEALATAPHTTESPEHVVARLEALQRWFDGWNRHVSGWQHWPSSHSSPGAVTLPPPQPAMQGTINSRNVRPSRGEAQLRE